MHIRWPWKYDDARKPFILLAIKNLRYGNALSQKIDEMNNKIFAGRVFSERVYCFLSYHFEKGLLGKINMKLGQKIVACNTILIGTKKWCHEYYMIVYHITVVCKWNSPSREQYMYLSIRDSYHFRMPYQSSHFALSSIAAEVPE